MLYSRAGTAGVQEKTWKVAAGMSYGVHPCSHHAVLHAHWISAHATVELMTRRLRIYMGLPSPDEVQYGVQLKWPCQSGTRQSYMQRPTRPISLLTTSLHPSSYLGPRRTMILRWTGAYLCAATAYQWRHTNEARTQSPTSRRPESTSNRTCRRHVTYSRVCIHDAYCVRHSVPMLWNVPVVDCAASQGAGSHVWVFVCMMAIASK